jgi:superfamily I DNA/RNA helicase
VERETKRALRLKNGQTRIDAVNDQAEMLQALAEGVRNVGEIEDRIEALFTDNGLGQAGMITCSSVHRAKGLEAQRVFILADTLKAHSIEEMNIQYVAITRAKETLVFVSDQHYAMSPGPAQERAWLQ